MWRVRRVPRVRKTATGSTTDVLFVGPRAVFRGASCALLCSAVLACLRCFPVLCSVSPVPLVGVLWCCLWFLVVSRQVSLSTVVSWRHVAELVYLSGPVAHCSVVGCVSWLCPPLLRSVPWCCESACCRAVVPWCLFCGAARVCLLCPPLTNSAKPVVTIFRFAKKTK